MSRPRDPEVVVKMVKDLTDRLGSLTVNELTLIASDGRIRDRLKKLASMAEYAITLSLADPKAGQRGESS